MKSKISIPMFAMVAALIGCSPAIIATAATPNQAKDEAIATAVVKTDFNAPANANIQKAVFAGGCFWGTEFYLRQVPGVTATAVGYIGGKTKNPTYRDVCYTDTGHAEAVLLEFDSGTISYQKLVEKFLEIHNPTTLNRQGPDYGSQYRSEIFTFNPEQAKIAADVLTKSKDNFKNPIVTKITAAPTFYFAENYHQQYAVKTGKTSCPIDRSAHKSGGN